MEDHSNGVGVQNEEGLHLPAECFFLPRLNVGFQIPYFLSSEEELAKIRPPAVVKTWEERFAELKPSQQKEFEKFYAAVQQASWYDAKKHDCWCCLRYLVSRSYDVSKALTMLANSAKWRRETGADEWTCEQCLRDPNQHMSQFIGWDRLHRPVLFMSMRWGPERKSPLRHMVTAFNHLVKMMPVGVEQWVCITDFATYSHIHDSKPGMAMSVIHVLQDHFPERLAKMICVNPPKMFSVLWKLIYPVIDPNTRTKINMVYTEGKPSAYEFFPTLFSDDLSHYLCDSYNRSKHNLPAKPLVWRPAAEGYPTTYDERKRQLKTGEHKKQHSNLSDSSPEMMDAQSL